MAYTLPQTRVFQDLTLVPAVAANPLRAHISGPHASLVRYAEADERPAGELTYYDGVVDQEFAWPNRPAGSVIDPGYTKLWIKDALLRYFQDTIAASSTITKTAGSNNRIRSATVNFATHGSYARSALLLDRDVRAGDVAKVRGRNGAGDSITLWTYVKSLLGDPVAAVVAAATADANNAAAQGAAATVERIAGTENCVALTPDGTSYNGLAAGDVTETYDVVVLQGSIDGDYTTARLRVISGSGNDDVATLTPSAAGVPTAIGTRGLVGTFDLDAGAACSASAGVDAVSPNDLVVGQRWQVTVDQLFTPATATAGGDYTGDSDTTYVVTVYRGGLFADAVLPQLLITTSNGVDSSGPIPVPAAATAVTVGTHEVTVAFSGTGLRKGDIYYIPVTAVRTGPLRTIELGHNLDTAIGDDTEVDLTLFIRSPLLQVERNRTGFAPLTNWAQDDAALTVHTGLVAYDPTWVSGSEPLPLDVVAEPSAGYGLMYVEYRAWRSDLCREVNGISDPAELDVAISGPLHVDNPLKWGVFMALTNANGSQVMFTAVCDPDDPSSWADVLELLVGEPTTYGLVPLTRDRTLLDLYAAHVTSQSAPEQAHWRKLWVNLEGIPERPIVAAGSTVPGATVATTTDGAAALAVIEDDPQTGGTQFTRVRVPAGNAAFLTNGVQPGDIARVLYTGDGFGGTVYSEYPVAAVRSEDELVLAAGPSAGAALPAKLEIWRNLTATEEAAALAQIAGSFASRRVCATWPDQIGAGTTSMEGYFLNCALAGLVSGVLPHQGLTRLAIAGFDDLSRTTRKFNRTQLDTLAASGVWIVTQDPTSGTVFSRHALTTGDQANINEREEMVTRNVDSISFRFQETFEPFIGVSNVTPGVQIAIRQEIGKLIDVLKSESVRTSIGNQLIDATIVEFGPHATFRDRYVLVLNCQIPYALNNFDVHLVI